MKKLLIIIALLALIAVTSWAQSRPSRGDSGLATALTVLVLSGSMVFVKVVIARRKGKSSGWLAILSAIPFVGLLINIYLASLTDKEILDKINRILELHDKSETSRSTRTSHRKDPMKALGHHRLVRQFHTGAARRPIRSGGVIAYKSSGEFLRLQQHAYYLPLLSPYVRVNSVF